MKMENYLLAKTFGQKKENAFSVKTNPRRTMNMHDINGLKTQDIDALKESFNKQQKLRWLRFIFIVACFQ